jgi:hypothetical protein
MTGSRRSMPNWLTPGDCVPMQPAVGASPWCVGEVAIAVNEGKTVIPIQLLNPDEEAQSQPLPSMLQTRQAIRVADALHPSAEQLAEVKQHLRDVLNASLRWREMQEWDPNQSPYPGLPAFEAHQAPVFVAGRLRS